MTPEGAISMLQAALPYRLGHSHPVVLQAIRDQIERISFAHTGFFTTKAAENLADKLIEKAPGDLEFVYYVLPLIK